MAARGIRWTSSNVLYYVLSNSRPKKFQFGWSNVHLHEHVKIHSRSLNQFGRPANFSSSKHCPSEHPAVNVNGKWGEDRNRHWAMVPRIERGSDHVLDNMQSSHQKTHNRYMAPALGFLYAALFSNKSESQPEEDELILLLKMAKLEQHRGEFRKAMQLYHQALKAVAERGKTDIMDEKEMASARVTIFDNMANLSLSLMQLEHAEKLFKETMKGLLYLGHDKNDDGMVEISLKLAMIYAMMGKNQDAEMGYKYCVTVQEKKVNEGSYTDEESQQNAVALLGMIVNSYARFLMVQYRLTEAETYLLKAIELCKQLNTEQNPQVAVLYNDLATVYSTKGDNDTAKDYFARAIEIGELTQSVDVATYLVNYGALCIDMGDLEKAEEYCNRSLKLAKLYKNVEAEKEALKHLQVIKNKSRS